MSAALGPGALSDLATRALVGLGLAPPDAADAASILVLGELMGLPTVSPACPGVPHSGRGVRS